MKIRRWCKRLLLGALTAGGGVIIAACYGPQSGMSDGYEIASGRVTAQGSGVAGLQVCARFDRAKSDCSTTGADGYYVVWGDQVSWDEAQQAGFDILVEDTDGAQNGAWAKKSVSVEPNAQLPVSMDLSVEPRVQ